MPVPTYVGSGAAAQTADAGTVAVPFHASTAVDDILLLSAETGQAGAAGTSGAPETPATPSGWTSLGSSPTGSITDSVRCSLFWKRATSGDVSTGSVTITNPGNHVHGIVTSFRGCVSTGTPFGTADAQAATASNSIPGGSGLDITTTKPDSLVVFVSALGIGAAGITWSQNASNATSPLTWTFRYSSRANTAGAGGIGNGGQLALNTAPKSSTGATGATTQSTTGTASASGNMLVELFGENAATMTMQLSSVTEAFVGGKVSTGTAALQLSSVTEAFTGTHVGGSFSMTLGNVTEAFAGQSVEASIAMTLPHITADIEGYYPVDGEMAATLSQVVIDFIGETEPFGAQVIKVEAESRAFRVTDEGTGLVPIKRSRVTDL